MAEGGMGGEHMYHEDTEQEQIANKVKEAGGSIDTFDGEYSSQWNGEKSPINKDLAKKMGKNPKTGKPYTPSEMTGAV